MLGAQAPGIPLSKVFPSMPHNELIALMENFAMLLISSRCLHTDFQ